MIVEHVDVWTVPVADAGVCHMAFVADPDGSQIVLHRRYAPRS